jgi:hypothetical protein
VSATLLIDHDPLVTVADPLPPRLLLYVQLTTVRSLSAAPETVIVSDVPASYVALLDGDVIVTVCPTPVRRPPELTTCQPAKTTSP